MRAYYTVVESAYWFNNAKSKKFFWSRYVEWVEKRVWVLYLPNLRAFFSNLVNFYSIYTGMPCNRLSELSKDH